ncbi:MAG TPA: ComF family protein [Rubrivivax sp.]|nr:ComF family protein [Rubrivivax sp.]
MARCGRCLTDSPPFDRTAAAVDYGFPWDGLVARLKFGQRPDLALALAEMMRESALRAGLLQSQRPDLLIPVPLSDQRLRSRGYNQAAELARALGRHWSMPVLADGVTRLAGAGTQSSSTREQRLQNLRGTMRVDRALAPRLRGLNVMLVDDVMTTGATVRELARVVRAAGAEHIDVCVFARTPP